MKKNYLVLSVLFFGLTIIKAQETTIPDDNFEAFLEANGMGNGIPNDDKVTTANISSVTALDISFQSISSLEGIEDFSSLKTLNAFINNLTAVDLSQNTALETVALINNNISSLNVSNLTSLKEVFAGGNSNLSSVNVNGCTALENLNVSNGNLAALNVSNLPALKTLSFIGNNVSSLNFSGSTAIQTFFADDNTSLGSLNLNSLTSLQTLQVENCGLTSLQISGATNLKTVKADNNNLNSLDASTLSSLETLEINTNNLSDLDISGATAIRILEAANNSLTLLDLYAHTDLVVVFLNDNSLEFLNLANGENGKIANTSNFSILNNPNLECVKVDDETYANTTWTQKDATTSYDIHCGEIKIEDDALEAYFETRNLGNHVTDDDYILEYLIADITNLNVNGEGVQNYDGLEFFPSLEVLRCENNNLTSLDVSKITKLKRLYCANNQISDLELPKDSQILINLFAENNQLVNIDLRKQPKLHTVDLDNNLLERLNVLDRDLGLTRLSVYARNNPSLSCVKGDTSRADDYFLDAGVIADDTCGETYVPDNEFEAFIEFKGWGNGISDDDYVDTSEIANVTSLTLLTGLEIFDLTGIADFTNLLSLSFDGDDEGEIPTVNLSTNSNLDRITLTNLGISSINLGNNPNLKILNFSGNQLSTIPHLPFAINLEELYLNDNSFTNLDLSFSEEIETIEVHNNPNFNSLTFGIDNRLKYIDVSDTNLSSFDTESAEGIREFNAENASFTSFNIEDNPFITDLNLNGNDLSELILTNGENENLTLDIRDNPNLECVEVDDRNYSTTNWTNIDVQTYFSEDCNATFVPLKIYLQGAFTNPNSGEASLMRDDLRLADQIPSTSPYSDARVMRSRALDASGNDAIVDWVFIEIRDANDTSVILDSTSALLQRDGDVVDRDGEDTIDVDVTSGDYFISVNHRNHIPIMTTNAVTLSNRTSLIDLSANTTAIEGGANAVQDMGNGIFALISGDIDANGQIQNNDVLSATQSTGASGYDNSDVDMNGQVQNSDINSLIIPAVGKAVQF